MPIQTINPGTQMPIKKYPLLSASQLLARIDAAEVCFQSWCKTTFHQRSESMYHMAHLLKRKKEKLAEIITEEMGKPISAAIKEVEKCAWVVEHYALQAEHYLASKIIQTDMRKTKICYQPFGVIFAIMPWNFPFWQVFRFAAPNIMAGNAVLLKHAPISTGAGRVIASLFLESGFPEHLFQQVIINNKLAQKVIAHEKVRGVTLTGSEKAGSIVGASAVKHLKKVVLELGGNDPYLVLADADLDIAADSIVASRMNNTGQVCIAAKRTIVIKEILEPLTEKILHRLKNYKMGDPTDPNTNFGPMAREDLRQSLHQQVIESIDKGARLLVGGKIPQRQGFYYPPTLITSVKPGMPAFDDELFGPVVALTSVQDEGEAITLANKSRFGLGAAIFTKDIEKGEYIATNKIHAGSCFVNTFVTSDPRVPFGGIKNSGFGRELSEEGIKEFVNIKTVSIK